MDTSKPLFDTENSIRAWSIGLRYLGIKPQNVRVGLDLARGSDEDAFYIQLGHPW